MVIAYRYALSGECSILRLFRVYNVNLFLPCLYLRAVMERDTAVPLAHGVVRRS